MGVVCLLNTLQGEVYETSKYRLKNEIDSASSSLSESSSDGGSLQRSRIEAVQLLNALRGQVGEQSKATPTDTQRHMATC